MSDHYPSLIVHVSIYACQYEVLDRAIGQRRSNLLQVADQCTLRHAHERAGAQQVVQHQLRTNSATPVAPSDIHKTIILLFGHESLPLSHPWPN